MNTSLRYLLPLAALLVAASVVYGQGQVWFNNSGARTRIGTPDGPFADGNILAQMLLGVNSNSLSPVGVPRVHLQGLVIGGTVTVPDIPGRTPVYIQIVAWNGLLWGSSLAGVPAEQIGRSDMIPHVLDYSFDPLFAPRFTQGAVVPVPEPAAWALSMLGLLGFLLYRRRS